MSIAFFGATGGCANASLALSLKAKLTCRALARNPEKLTSLLIEQGISQSVIDSNLTIIKGGIDDKKSIISTLKVDDNEIASKIVSGIGGKPTLQFCLSEPVTLTDPTICQRFTGILLEVLAELEKSIKTKPSIIVVSSTGISDGPQDVPFGYRILYGYFLHAPHVDKKVMEKQLKGEEAAKLFSEVILVRPTLLTGSHLLSSGKGSVKVGTEEKPVLGYTVTRADVGEWIFKEFIEGKREGGVYTLTN
ncbi:DEKNAAC105326 [Brettanomyces naardenensis]|uniref:DEKNAAC105326 n=1 Tax=Brettanomyces naardenensis TaxID=13370 RepID=A0A448YTJ5_BRENA|nr:DEKNAAC105326 [Brettanomyces naardenensis]